MPPLAPAPPRPIPSDRPSERRLQAGHGPGPVLPDAGCLPAVLLGHAHAVATPPTEPPPPLTTRRLLLRGITKRCPVCGEYRLFRRWFTIVEHRPRCGFRLERVEGQ